MEDHDMSDTYIAADQLRSIVERIERLEEEIKALNEGKSEIYTEAKGNGYDVKVLKRIVADRRKGADEVSEFEAILELYRKAISEPHVRAREAA